tara:strand:- start:3401 stop:3589 length:189 start_codon:yes stop_codon:yes gene_type:complete
MEDMGEIVGDLLEGLDTITIVVEETIEQPDEAEELAVVAVEVEVEVEVVEAEAVAVVEGVDS